MVEPQRGALAREHRAGIPDSRLLVLRGAAHNPLVDAPAAFNEAVLRFLRDQPAY